MKASWSFLVHVELRLSFRLSGPVRCSLQAIFCLNVFNSRPPLASARSQSNLNHREPLRWLRHLIIINLVSSQTRMTEMGEGRKDCGSLKTANRRKNDEQPNVLKSSCAGRSRGRRNRRVVTHLRVCQKNYFKQNHLVTVTTVSSRVLPFK